MVIKFRSISAARQHLKDCGYRFSGFGRLTKGERYTTHGLVALITKVPFKGYRVHIDAAA